MDNVAQGSHSELGLPVIISMELRMVLCFFQLRDLLLLLLLLRCNLLLLLLLLLPLLLFIQEFSRRGLTYVLQTI